MGRIVATIFYIDEDLLQKFDDACRQLNLRITRSAVINFLIYKFLVDNGFEAETILEYEDLITKLYTQLMRRKRAKRRRLFRTD